MASVPIFATLGLALATPGWAQSTDGGEIDEIVVTATKREQSIHDVPIAISAFDGEQLQRRGVEDLSDLQLVSPSLIIDATNSTSNGGVLRIRGMGTSGNNLGLESAVGVFVDGVFRSRAGLAFQDLIDVERIEVLRGPQGTLFGKNTSAGAVSIVTRKPSFDWEGFVAGTYGSQRARKVQASVSGPVVPELLAFRVAGSWHERDGSHELDNRRSVFPNTMPGTPFAHPRAGQPTFDPGNGDRKFNGRDRWSGKAQLLFTPTEDFDARLIVDYTRHTEDCCAAGFSFLDRIDDPTTPGLPPAVAYETLIGASLSEDAKSHRVGANFAPVEDTRDKGVTLEANWRLGTDVTLTAIAALREFTVFRTQDIDFSEADVLQGAGESEEWDTWSAEVRLVGSHEGFLSGFDWLVGFYALDEEVSNAGAVRFASEGAMLAEFLTFGSVFGLLPAVVPNGTGTAFRVTQDTRSYALFTHNQLFLTEEWDLTVGARFTWEEKQASQIPQTGTPFTDPTRPDPATIRNHTGCASGPLFLQLRQFLVSICDNFAWKDEVDSGDWSLFASLGWQLHEDHNAYLSFGHGFKSGGWNGNANSLQIEILDVAGGANCDPNGVNTTDGMCGFVSDRRRFEPEFTNNFELGLKSRFLGGRLRVSTTAFHTVFKNFQLQTFTGLFFFIENIPRVKARGMEVEGTVQLSDAVLAHFGITYADTRYGSSLSIQPAPPFRLDHQRISNAPAWSGSLGLETEWALSGGWTLLGSGNLLYRGRRNTGGNLDPRKLSGDFTQLNLTAGIRSPDGRWQLDAWVENLFDTRTLSEIDSVLGNSDNGAGGGNLTAFVSNGRLLGVTLTYRFGSSD